MRRIKKWGIGTLALLGTLLLFLLGNYLLLPDVLYLRRHNPHTTAFMRRYRGPKPIRHLWVGYENISPHLKEAVVIAEDGRFFEHGGIDWESVKEAFKENWKKQKFKRGASTITQQTAKNLYLSPAKNPFRKVKEMLLAIKLEQHLSKQRILEIYLNVAEWGEGLYGAEAASRHYFGVSARNLTPSQASWMAAILPNPRFYQKNRTGGHLTSKKIRIEEIMGYIPPASASPSDEEIIEW